MKGRLLNPLVDPVFKRIFGEEKKLMISLINAAISPTVPVVEIEYLQPELVPQYGFDKGTIVDVRCRDASKRHFIVEMQISTQQHFNQRVLYNAAKVYSRQLKGFIFPLLNCPNSGNWVNLTLPIRYTDG